MNEKQLQDIKWGRGAIKSISEMFLKEGKPYVVLSDGQHINEMLLLFAKQTQLLESFLLLIESNHTEEAIIIFRSMINNSMLIHYLSVTDPSEVKTRYNNYKAQPIKGAIKRLNNYKEILEKDGFSGVDIDNVMSKEDVNNRISELKDTLIRLGLVTSKNKPDVSLLNIKSLAREDKTLFGMYVQYYDIASKYEHSDPTSLDIYKQPIDKETPISHAYIMDLSRTDDDLHKEIFYMCLGLYGMTFINFLSFLQGLDDYLLEWSEEENMILAKLSIQFHYFVHFH